MKIAEIRGLNKTYPSFRLRDVSFSIEAGSITGFIGRNGAGKTTTIKSMLGLVHPDSGAIIYLGKPLVGHETEIKKKIGYSTGTINWYPRKKLKEVIAVVRDCYDTWDGEAYGRYRDLFAIDEDKTALQLSEGMKVKANLLIALSHKAEILILDEPTSGLDPFSRDELLRIFEELKKDGVAIFFSTHIISDIEKCADDIIYISGGQIVSACSKAEFISQHSLAGESLEETFLRMEGATSHAAVAAPAHKKEAALRKEKAVTSDMRGGDNSELHH